MCDPRLNAFEARRDYALYKPTLPLLLPYVTFCHSHWGLQLPRIKWLSCEIIWHTRDAGMSGADGSIKQSSERNKASADGGPATCQLQIPVWQQPSMATTSTLRDVRQRHWTIQVELSIELITWRHAPTSSSALCRCHSLVVPRA